MKKCNKGITLIALIITIIVLLILAGVTISMILGDNGIAQKATNAKESTKAKDLQEQIDFAVSENSFVQYDGGTIKTKNSLVEEFVEEGKLTGKDAEILKTQDTIEIGGVIVDFSKLEGENKKSFVSEIDTSNYGDYVNYEVDLGIVTAGKSMSDGSVPQTDWRIFYKDENNVFLIASDYLPVIKFPSGVFGGNNGKYNGYWIEESKDTTKLTTSGNITANTNFLFTGLSNVTTTNINYQAVSTLLDSSKWSIFAKTGYVDDVSTAVIGSPTVEMWMASWNAKYGDTLAFDSNKRGYNVGLTANTLNVKINDTYMQAKDGWKDTLYYPHASTSNSWNDCSGYILASPANGSRIVAIDTIYIYYRGELGCNSISEKCYGIRPVVCLKTGITAEKDENGVWQLDK